MMAISTIKNWVQKQFTGTYKDSFKIDADGDSPCTLENDSGALKTNTVNVTKLNVGATPVELTDNSGDLAIDADVMLLGTTPVAIKSDSGVLKITNAGGVEKPVLNSKMTFTGEYSMTDDISAVTVMEAIVPMAGYLVASAVLMVSARTAGSIAFTVFVNGVAITPTGLNLAIDDDPTTKVAAAIDYGTADYDVAAGDVISIEATSTQFTPDTNTIKSTLIVEG